MEESPDGQYVSFEDYQLLLAELTNSWSLKEIMTAIGIVISDLRKHQTDAMMRGDKMRSVPEIQLKIEGAVLVKEKIGKSGA